MSYHTMSYKFKPTLKVQKPEYKDVQLSSIVLTLFYLVHIKEELQQLFGVSVDIIRIKPEMDSLLKRDIMRDCIYA